MSIYLKSIESKALELIKAGKLDLAIGELNEAIGLAPEDPGLRFARSIAFHSKGKWQEALSDAEKAMLIAPLPIGVQLVLGDCYAATGKQSLAIMAYKHLLKSSKLSSEILADIYAGFRKCQRDDLALSTCRRAIEVDEDNHAAYFGMAHCMSSLGYAPNYIANILREAVDLAPENMIYRYSFITQAMRAGDNKTAYQELKQLSMKELKTIPCLDTAQRLLELSIWASDIPRSRAIGSYIKVQLSKQR